MIYYNTILYYTVLQQVRKDALCRALLFGLGNQTTHFDDRVRPNGDYTFDRPTLRTSALAPGTEYLSIYLCTYMYVYICIYTSLSLSLYIYIYIHIRIHTHICVCIYIYIYIYRERERFIHICIQK